MSQQDRPKRFDLYFVRDDDGSISSYDSSICENDQDWVAGCKWAEPNNHVIEYSAYQKLEAALKVAIEALEDIAFSRCRFTIGNDRTQRILIAKDAVERIKKVIG